MNTSAAAPATPASDSPADLPTESAAAAPSPASSVNAARALLKTLEAQFPAFRDCLPLAIGIDKQLLARLPDLERKVLRTALRMHTHSLRYLKGMEKATTRFDLDGQPGEAVDEAHRAHASETLRERFKKNAEQRKAQVEAGKAQREAEEAKRRRAEKLDQLAAKFGRR
ncbi:MAG: activator of osmoprotectant transporter prop [Candidatus Accumulibacter sp.]|nr:activator of osmoprotectant transporter prop [Accumulibacter sp.]